MCWFAFSNFIVRLLNDGIRLVVNKKVAKVTSGFGATLVAHITDTQAGRLSRRHSERCLLTQLMPVILDLLIRF